MMENVINDLFICVNILASKFKEHYRMETFCEYDVKDNFLKKKYIISSYKKKKAVSENGKNKVIYAELSRDIMVGKTRVIQYLNSIKEELDNR